MKRQIRFWVVIGILISANIVWAQPPGGGGRTGGAGGLAGGEGENGEVPDINDIELDIKPDIDVDAQSANLMATIAAREGAERIPFDITTFTTQMENFEIPQDWSQIAALTEQMPNKDEILAMKDELPHDIDIEDLDIGLESSPTATSAIVGYASSMLGLNVTPLYAGEYGDTDVSSSEAAQQTIDVVYSELDSDMQSLLTQADSLSGVTYWALLDDGLALLYTGDCDLEQCTIDQQAVQVEITSGSAGAYAIYSDTPVSSTSEALALVQNTFPYLSSIELSETESSAGTAFFAFDIDMDSSQVTAYYAGVYDSNGKSLVYAVSGIGDAYINMLLGGG